jgi:hypothetical protein
MGITFPSWITEAATWNEDVIYLLDGELRFLDCNPAWDRFAAANDGRGISRTEVLGRLILDYVPDVLRTLYVHKYWLSKRSEGWTEFNYDCSSPEKIRLFRMGMIGVGEGLLVVNHLRLEEGCEVQPPLTEAERRSYISPDGFVTMCANCRKTRRSDDATTWNWIPDFLRDRSLKVSHGLCPRCISHLYL